jgi:hypothetical protein
MEDIWIKQIEAVENSHIKASIFIASKDRKHLSSSKVFGGLSLNGKQLKSRNSKS